MGAEHSTTDEKRRKVITPRHDTLPVDPEVAAELDLIDRKCAEIGRRDPLGAVEMARKGLRLAARSATPDEEVRFLLRMAYHTVHIGKNDAAYRYLTRTERIMEREPVRHIRVIDLEHNWGYYYHRRGDYPRATEHFSRSLHLAEQVGSAFRIMSAYSSLANILTLVGDYAGAMGMYLASLNVPGRDRWPGHIALMLHNMATVHMKMEDWPNAVDYLRRSVSMFEEADNRINLAGAYMNLGKSLVRLENYVEGFDYLERAMAMHRALEFSAAVGPTLAGFGEGYVLKKEYEVALRYFIEAAEAYESTDNYRGRIYAAAQIGEVQLELKRPLQAIETLERVLEKAVALGYRDYEEEILRLLADAYEQTGEPLKSLQAIRRHLEIRRELAEQERREAFLRAQVRHAVWEIEEQRNRLLQEKERLEVEMERKERALTSISLRLTQSSSHLMKIREQIRVMIGDTAGELRRVAKELMRGIDTTEREEKEWDEVERRFMEVDGALLRMLGERYPALTRTEAVVCCLLRNNLSSKEIALLLGTSVRTVESHRRFIRRKLSLPGRTDLAAFMATLPSDGAVTIPKNIAPST